MTEVCFDLKSGCTLQFQVLQTSGPRISRLSALPHGFCALSMVHFRNLTVFSTPGILTDGSADICINLYTCIIKTHTWWVVDICASRIDDGSWKKSMYCNGLKLKWGSLLLKVSFCKTSHPKYISQQWLPLSWHGFVVCIDAGLAYIIPWLFSKMQCRY